MQEKCVYIAADTEFTGLVSPVQLRTFGLDDPDKPKDGTKTSTFPDIKDAEFVQTEVSGRCISCVLFKGEGNAGLCTGPEIVKAIGYNVSAQIPIVENKTPACDGFERL